MTISIRSAAASLFAFAFIALVASSAVQAAPPVAVPSVQPVVQAASPDKPPTAAELESLANTLEDPADRAKLVEQLRALVAAERADKPKPVEPVPLSAVAAFLSRIAEKAATLGDNLTSAAATLNDLPHIQAWVEGEVTNPDRLERWMRLGWKIATVLIVASVAGWIVRRLLSRPRNAVDGRGETLVLRWVFALARMILDLAPIGAFIGAGYLTLPLIGAGHKTSLVSVALMNAYVVVRVVLAISQRVLAPGRDAIRLVPIGDETASYIHVWVGRLTALAVYGYVAVEAASLLGVPDAVDGLLMRLVGLVVLAMIVILILQNRASVSNWLRRDRPSNGHSLRTIRRRFADIWHVLLILYVCAVYAVWALDIEDGFEFLLRGSLLTIVILVTTRLLGALLRRAVDRGFSLSTELKERLPALEARANRYLPILHTCLRVALYVIAFFMLLQVWGAHSFAWIVSDVGKRLTGSVAAVVIVVALSIMLWEILSSLIERYLGETDENGIPLPRSARTRTLLPLLRNATLVVLVTFVSLTVLSQIGIDIAPLLAGAGVVGLAIGFGAQTLVKDVITGLFILFEDTISVGDVIEVDSRSGVVETITIRTIRLRDQAGSVHTVPFSSVTSVKNLTRQFAFYVFKLGVGYDTDIDQAIQALQEVDEDMRNSDPYRNQILAPLDIQGLDQFGDSALIIQARTKTLPMQQWNVGREFNKRIKIKFDEYGIDIAYPHRTIQIVQAPVSNQDGPEPPSTQRALPQPAPLP